MPQYTGDPLADFDAYDRECQAWLDRQPKCKRCKEPIQDESYFYIDFENVCSDCLEDYCKEHFLISNEEY